MHQFDSQDQFIERGTLNFRLWIVFKYLFVKLIFDKSKYVPITDSACSASSLLATRFWRPNELQILHPRFHVVANLLSKAEIYNVLHPFYSDRTLSYIGRNYDLDLTSVRSVYLLLHSVIHYGRMDVNNLKVLKGSLSATTKLEYLLAEILNFVKSWQEYQNGLTAFILFIYGIVPYLVQYNPGHLKELLVCVGLFVAPDNRSPFFDIISFDEFINCVQIVIRPFEAWRLIDIDSRTGELRIQKLKRHFVINLSFLLFFFIAVLVHKAFVVTILLQSFELLELYYFLVEVLSAHKRVNMVRSKVIFEQFIVDSSTHQNYSDLRILSYHSFKRSKYEISINVSFVHLI